EYLILRGDYVRSFVQVVATATGFGPDWMDFDPQTKSPLAMHLVKDDVPITGRVLDLQGRPVAAADVRLLALETSSNENLTAYLDDWKAKPAREALRSADKILLHPYVAGLPKVVHTDADGRFRLTGGGRERIARLSIEAPMIETMVVRVMPRPAAEIKPVSQGASERAMAEHPRNTLPTLYGVPFEHVAGPTKPIVGTVRD